jgi:hypothetical protein
MACYPDRTRDNIKYYLGDTELILKNPQYGDTELIVKKRQTINTRGLRLRTYRRTIWPAYRQLSYEFVGLCESDKTKILGFIKDTQGLEINLLDYNDRVWTGVISNPDLKVTQLGLENYTTTIEFEGDTPISKPNFDDLVLISRNPDYGDSVSNVLETSIKYSLNGKRYTYNKSTNRKLFEYKFTCTYAKAREFVDFFWFYEDEIIYFQDKQGIIKTTPEFKYDNLIEISMMIEEIE